MSLVNKPSNILVGIRYVLNKPNNILVGIRLCP